MAAVSLSYFDINPRALTVEPRPPSLCFKDKKERVYELIEKVGAGACGQVWKTATKTRIIALKIFRPGPQSLELVKAESKILQSVQTAPHVVKYKGAFTLTSVCDQGRDPASVIGFQKEDGPIYALAMEYIRYKDAFETFITPLSNSEIPSLAYYHVLNIGRQALETLVELESLNIVHREIKPSNFIYDPDTTLFKLLDFGYAEHAERIDFDDLVQARYYRAPEVFLCGSYSTKIDIWSLGVSLFAIYTGKPLFPISGDEKIATSIDHLYMMIQILGLSFSYAFIDSIDPCYRNDYFTKTSCKTLYRLVSPPSKKAVEEVNEYRKWAQNYRSVPVWEGCILQTAQLKGDSERGAKRLIALIRPMLAFENRINAAEALKFFPRTTSKT